MTSLALTTINVIAAFLLFANPALAQQATTSSNNPAPNPESSVFELAPRASITVGHGRDPRHVLHNVADAVLLSSGSLAVAISGGIAPGVRVFSDDGSFIRELLAGTGNGRVASPRQIASLQGDSLVVLDMISRRVVLVDATGTVVRSVDVSTPRAICCATDGSFLVQSVVANSNTERGNQQSRIRYSYALQNVHVSSRPARRILVLEGAEATIAERFPSTEHPGSMAIEMRPRPFARPITVGFAGTLIVHAVGDEYRFDTYDQTGRKVRTVSSAVNPVPITAADVARAKREFVAAVPVGERRQGLERLFGELTHPSTKPAFGGMLTEENGTVWLRNYSETAASEEWWAGFSASGQLLGTLRIPSGKHVLRFSRGHAILVEATRAADSNTTIEVRRVERR